MRQHPVARWLLVATLAAFAAAALALVLAPMLPRSVYVAVFAFFAGVALTAAWLVAEYATRGWVRRHPIEGEPVLEATDQGRRPR